MEEEESHLGEEPFNLTKLEYAQYCYDATWTLAYALDRTIKGIVDHETAWAAMIVNFLIVIVTIGCSVCFLFFF